jgi:peptidoglycan hydrolase-like protein with peptidoglycan-binding domain
MLSRLGVGVQKRVMGRAPSKDSFNILDNPFVLLGVEPSASNREVLDAVDDRMADDPSLEEKLTNAKQIILNPRLRVDAELATLIDTPTGESRTIIAHLRSNSSNSYLRHEVSRLAPLSCCNLVAHLSAQAGPDADLLLAFVDAKSKVVPENVISTLDRIRKLAGIIKPDPDIVRDGLYRLGEMQAHAIFDGYRLPLDAATDAAACAARALLQPDVARTDALEGLLRGYRRRVDPDLSRKRQEIETASETLRHDSVNANALNGLVQAIREWDSFGKPLQLLEAYKGRDEPEARSVYESVRALSIDIANQYSRFDVALEITRVSAEAFSRLPRAASQISEDLKSLEERVAGSAAEPLVKFISDLDQRLKALAGALIAEGFATNSRGLAGELFVSFSTAVSKTKPTTAAELPWVLLRNLAVKLNNEANEPAAALVLVDGMLLLAATETPVEEVLQTLRTDRIAAERQVLQTALVEHVKSNRHSDALAAIRKLIATASASDELRFLQDLRRTIEKKIENRRNSSYVRWVVFAFIGLIIAISALSNNKPAYLPPRPIPQPIYSSPEPPPQHPQPPLEQPTTAPSLLDTAEAMPPIGSNLEFARGNIRYCDFQRARLEFSRTIIVGGAVLDSFNRAIDDWNSRCSSYRYLQEDRSAVEAELLVKQSDLQAQARGMVADWTADQRALLPSLPTTPEPVPSEVPLEPTVLVPPPMDIRPTKAATPTSAQTSVDLSTSAPINLLGIEEAGRVQKRLSELGFFKGPANGTWGPLSRAALHSFKLTNNLSDDAMLDSQTGSKLFSSEAVHAALGQSAPARPIPESLYPPANGSNLNPLNKADAIRIHARLRELGFYKGNNDTLWSGASRVALREFKIKNGLASDDNWDGQTEYQLFNAPPR